MGSGAYGASDPGVRALAGTTVTIAASTLRGDAGFERELEAFTELTGIELDLGSSEEQDVQNIATGDLEPPDIVAFGGGIPTWAQPRAIDIGQFVDSEALRSDFGEYLLSFGTVADGRRHPIPGRNGSCDPSDGRPEGPRVLPEGRVRGGRV